MRVALRSGNFTELRKRIDKAQSGENTDVGEMSELILSLSTALSRHDRKTRGHSERTRAYTDIIAEEMGLSETDRDKLRWAALLHDVGKLEVPAEILNKDTKLDDHEWHLVRQHPVFGMNLIAPLVPWLGPWAQTVEHHHERYDGTGYPHGLSGTNISLGARIVSVGDAYDVMTSGRAYQRPKTPAQAREEIARMSGQQFDPVVVRALMNVSLGRLRGATGPVAVLAELPFIRGLPQIGRDAATLLTSSAVMATSMAIGVVPAPATLLPNDIAAAVGELLPGGPEDVETGDPPAVVADDPNPAVTTTTTVAAEPQTDDPQTDDPPADGEPADVDPDPEGPSPTTTAPPPPTATPVAGSPVAAADAARTSEDTAAIIDVLANDSDPDGDLEQTNSVQKQETSG
jgi:putative nucleotidyltransferase with HDIG domain